MKREALAGLASEDLRSVAGGASVSPTCYSCLTLCNPICKLLVYETFTCPQAGGAA